MQFQRQQFSLKDVRPKAIDPEGDLIEKTPGFPTIYRPVMDGISLKLWLAGHQEEVEEDLKVYGAILFRGFDVPDRNAFQDVMLAFNEEFLSYKDRSSPRTEVKENLYTSTEHPADQVINMHNELSYSHTWPLRIAFYCSKEPAEKGETPIADVRKVLQRLPEKLVNVFKEKGILYRRLLQKGVGLSWQEVFQTEDQAVVEQHCKTYGQEFSWTGNDRLEIRWHRPAVRTHPVTGEEVWFNHGYFFNFLALAPEIRAAFSSSDELPFNTYYGDGSPIEAEYLELIHAAYEQECVYFPWKRKDILLMDNMLAAHGRNSFKGTREINVIMMKPIKQ
ncbi:TauD/TfdA family dioxygenase [Chitinophaga sp. CF418]|uniref:TauD/TfdA family dioxygenase n=1 Tax=Chitinophaga sp. CF418 TaxID=1855287 RepID=UPI000921AC43|nr:TauD/TfdA family dioxygenase [Chitinophaga sp. CF418]SHN40691.1 Taurine dioxygenase, alpha-ketoglutarate-dependent [Chitinophaga sp. CF418]